jgi:Putative beta-barrel porin 2
MKIFFVSAGLVAAGVASLHAQYAPGLSSMEASKLWSISGTLRGFFDDNYTTSHSDATGKRASFGFEASPSLSLNVPLQQTEIGLRYTYGLYYYEDREAHGQNPIDQTHQADLWIDHAFTERWEAKFQDTFVVSQEPQLNGATALPFRTEGNNIANIGAFTVHTEWTQLLSTDVGYQNSWSDYQNHGDGVPADEAANPSLSGLLDRVEQLAWLNVNWQLQPETALLVGYQYGQVNYLSSEVIAPSPTGYYHSDSRDNRSQYGYVGAQHAFLDNFSVTAKAGIQYVDDYNDPSGSSQLTPYADIAATYTYMEGSYAQVGFTQSRNATDIASVNSSGQLTLDQESSVVYASVNHQITPNLLASVVGHWQYSIYHGGLYNGKADIFYNLGLNLSYTFNPHISAEVGYNFDYLASDIPNRSYSRNRVYIGATATY